MIRVAPGQVWLINLTSAMARGHVTIDRIEGKQAICRTASGREHSFAVRTLERGARSARLVAHADGTPVEASTSPVPTRKPSRMERAVALHLEGKTPTEIAKSFDCGTSEVLRWIRASDLPTSLKPPRREAAKPRGGPSPRALEAYELSRRELASSEIAEKLGVSRNGALKMLLEVRQERGEA